MARVVRGDDREVVWEVSDCDTHAILQQQDLQYEWQQHCLPLSQISEENSWNWLKAASVTWSRSRDQIER
jgi:hypothetical protein